MKALALLCLALGCARIVEVPRVVTVSLPYVPVLPLEAERDSTILGEHRCDLNGNSAIFIDITQPPETQQYVYLHEMVHVHQARAHGGCVKLGERYRDDLNFRLMIEVEAFCAVLTTQQKAGVTVWPDRKDILWRLGNRYGLTASADSIEKAVRC